MQKSERPVCWALQIRSLNEVVCKMESQLHLSWNCKKDFPFLWSPWCGVRAISADFKLGIDFNLNWTPVRYWTDEQLKTCSNMFPSRAQQPGQKPPHSLALAHTSSKYVWKLTGSTERIQKQRNKDFIQKIEARNAERCTRPSPVPPSSALPRQNTRHG